ncbi:MAG: AAA family ATPase [Chloroflexi bacterium]|nr:AAA family ATPase [Chloroflexota bacterium]
MALTRVAKGQSSTVLLTGQPGIGKTRLARETLALAKGRGFTVLEGRVFPMQDGLAYAPIIDALDPLLHSLDATSLRLLVHDLPELGRILTGLDLAAPSLSAGRGDPAIEKTLLFGAVSRLLQRLAQQGPVVLFVDDLNWVDSASLDLLHFLARGLAEQPVLLLFTYGADASDASSRLQAMVESLERHGLAEEIVVPRLGPDSVEKQVRGILGATPPGDLVAFVEARACGTPLFIEGLVAALIDAGSLVHSNGVWNLDARATTVLPPSIRRLILRRLAGLESDERRVLEFLSVIGEVTSHAILQSASGLHEEALLSSLRHLRAMGLVAESVDGPSVGYSMTHPLVQEVVCAEVPEVTRRRAHLAAIDAIESFPEGRPDDLKRLAHHYHAAGPEANRDRTLTVLLAAGDRARALYANEEAARHYSSALAMVRERHHTQGVGEIPATLNPQQSSTLAGGLPWLLERLGEVWERVGKHDAAVEVWNEALVLLSEGLVETERAGPSEERIVAASRLRRQLALAEWDRGRFDTAKAHLRIGLAAMVGHQPCQELADLYYVRFFLLWRAGDVAGAADTVAKLLSLAEQLASSRAAAEANATSALLLGQDDIVAARERAFCVLTMGESASGGQDPGLCCRAHSLLVSIGMRLGDYSFMREHAERGLAIARRLGASSLEVFLRSRLAYAHFLAGAWEESLSSSLEAVALARRVGHPRDLAYALARWAMILAFQGNWLKAELCIAEARLAFVRPSSEGWTDKGVSGLIHISEAAVALERGQVDRALGIAKGFLAPSEPVDATSELTMSCVQIGLMLLAETQVAAGEPEKALETSRRLAGLGPSGTPYLTALASRVEGLARRALGQREAALDCLASAQRTFTALEMPFETAKCLLQQAVTAGPDRPYLAVRAAQQSLTIFERLGAKHCAERAGRLLRGLGVTPLATQRPHLGRVTVSERELQIARLVAHGLTNTEIANHLIISPRTVETHVKHIYARLSIGSRTALARLVMEAGLLSSAD